MAEIIEFNKEKNEVNSENILSELEASLPQLEGIGALVQVMELSDEEFENFSPLVLEEVEKAFNNSNDKYNLALALNMSGKSVAELDELFATVLEEIDNSFSNYKEDRRDFLKKVIYMMVNSLKTGKAAHNRIIRIPIELCNENAQIPTYAHDGDAGCDVYALEDKTVEPKETVIIPLGFKVAIPAGYELQIRPRSGMSSRTKIRIANAPGTIDSGYRGEVGVIIDNIGDYPFYIVKGQRIAQMVLSEVPAASFYQVSKVDEIETTRGIGGYGSSGK